MKSRLRLMPRSTPCKLFHQAPPRSLTFLPEAGHFALELSCELVDEQLASEENIPQPVQHALFQFVPPDAAVSIANAGASFGGILP
jgi:hypothetical protein